MKKFSLLLLALGLLFVSCEKDQDAILSSLKVENEKITPSYTSILIECQLKTAVSITSVFVQYSTTNDFAEYQEIQMDKRDGTYFANIDELCDNTTYYVRYSVANRYSSMLTKEITSTKTLVPSVPEIQILSITNVLDKSADVLFDLKFDGGAEITQLGICWGTSNKPSLDSDHFVDTKDNKTIVSLSTLQENTTYYVRAYAKNKVGIAYSESTAFTTLTLPKVQTNDISSVQLTSAMLNALLLSNGNDSTITKGFCWSESTNPTLSSSHIEVNVPTLSYTYQLSNLKDETQYYVRAYAKNKIGTVYGSEKTFTTLSATKPVVTTSTASEISYTSVTVGGNVTSDGGATVTERGICYSKSSSPTISNSKVISGSGIGAFTTNLTGLSDGTTYYVRAYAINSKGTSYGSQVTLTTKAYSTPTVTTNTVTDITSNSATISGNVTSDGGATVTERGICYSTSSSPTISNSRVASGTGTGSFSVNLTNLSANTKYYYRAYAKNSKGVSYGNQGSFTTKMLHEYVDLGLSVKWATCNVGATKPEESGDYFAWGEIGDEVKIRYNWTTYKYCNGSAYSLTKYDYDSDGKSTLEFSDDAAYVNWGTSWRMPTKTEFTELMNSCIWTWTQLNGVNGYNIKGPSGNSIFIPAAGSIGDSGAISGKGSYGNYWTSDIYTGYSNYNYAYSLYFYNGGQNIEYRQRCLGYFIRPVYRY